MIPAMKDMDSGHSGTGVFYQALPAVGADGKNIMKLIPVQMVNGQFFRSQISQPKTDPPIQKAVTINTVSLPVQMVKKSSLNPPATPQFVRTQVSLMNALHSQAGFDLSNSLNKHPLQQQNVNLMAIVPPTPATNSEKSGRLPVPPPVTVKPPALPRGQCLQISPNAQVRTVPASELPAAMKKHIFTSSASSSLSSSSPSVLYVSPVTTVNLNTAPQSQPAPHSNKTSCAPPSEGQKPHLKLIQKPSQRPNSPIKWVIEEEQSPTAPSVDSVNSSVTSEILRVVAERENATKLGDVTKNTVCQSSQDKSAQRQENSLVMCNGKVFYGAKNHSLPQKLGKSDSCTSKRHEFNKSVMSSPEKKQHVSVIPPHDEVIDLCDDDAHDDSASVHTSAVARPDEDNVIFVSYIPPKSESAQDLRPKTQTAAVEETNQTSTRSSDRVTEQKSLNGSADDDLGGGNTDLSTIHSIIRNLTNVCSSAVMNLHDNEGSDISSQQSSSTQQLQSMEVNVETQSPADPTTSDSSSGEICSPVEKDAHRIESSMNPATIPTSSVAPESCQLSDNLLRQMFGITADVKICLQRLDGAAVWSLPAEAQLSESVRSAEGHQEETNLQDTDRDSSVFSVQKVKVQTEQDPSAAHTDCGPLKWPRLRLNTKPLSVLKNKCHSGNTSLKGTSCDVESEPVIGYMEPIDEDFLSTDENAPQPQTCTDLNTYKRRMGRTRKRTMCPCCVPGTQGPAVKSSIKSEEAERRTTERTSKRRGRRKAVRTDVKTSERISFLTDRRKSSCETHDEDPADDGLSTAADDDDEVKQYEEIKRLKELLREKEAALERLRNSS